MATISRSNTVFALELLRTLSHENPSGNIFVSPLSISSAMAMVYLGAKGDTAAQMAQALAFSLDTDVHADFQRLNADINSPSASYILKLANRLYGENTANFLPTFLDATQKIYQADLRAVDFIGASETCRLPYNYIPDHGLQILELPYVDEELSMFILLPEVPEDGSNPLLKVHNPKTALHK
uniref:Serpin family B member 1 n=1 Tax=Acanthochromis polyacanthus TaxID=80966 RepID=A0A3Q1F5G5_9TELE